MRLRSALVACLLRLFLDSWKEHVLRDFGFCVHFEGLGLGWSRSRGLPEGVLAGLGTGSTLEPTWPKFGTKILSKMIRLYRP